MSKHYHVYFYPGEQYSLDNEKIYLGFMLAVGSVVKTDTSIKFVNKSSAISSNDYVDFSVGKGLKISKKLPMALEGSMVGDGRGFVVPGLGLAEPKTIWFETSKDLTVDYAQYYGKIISFEDGSYDTIASVPITREPDTNMYKIVLSNGSAVPGAAEIGVAPLLPNKEIWWENWMLTLAEIGSVGILELVYGVRDATLPIADQMTTIYSKKQYKSALMTAAVKGTYGDSPYFTYDLPVECSKFTGEEIIMATNQKVQNVVASDREFVDKIVVTFDDLPFATKYQVYCATKNDSSLLTMNDDETAEECSPPFEGVVDFPTDKWFLGNVASETNIDISPYKLQRYVHQSPHIHEWVRGNGLIKVINGNPETTEISVDHVDWITPSPGVGGVYTYFHWKLKYSSNPGEFTSSAHSSCDIDNSINRNGVHLYYWVRALIDNDRTGDAEWTELSEVAHGCTKVI